MDMRPTVRQQELIDLAAKLARKKFEPRAAELDRDARFPFEDYDDLREAGLLALCVPEAYGGLGGDLETYVLVVEQIAKGNAATALAPSSLKGAPSIFPSCTARALSES